MRIDFDDEEYPELSRYLSDPKRKMKFLYYLEELFESKSFDPLKDGLQPLTFNSTISKESSDDKSELYSFLSGISSAIENLSKNMEGSVIGRFPMEHVVHEVETQKKPDKPKYQEDENDYSSMEGIDFTQALAMFEE